MTKYGQIVEWAREAIGSGEMADGQRFYTEKEICEAHGVSRQTVRQALAVLEKEGLLERRRGSGTYVRRRAVQPGRTVGVVSTYFSDYIFPGIITGVERRLSTAGYGTQLAITNNRVQDEATALTSLLAQNVAGLIVEPTKSALPGPNRALYAEIERRGIPLVFFNARYPWAAAPLAAMDDLAAGRMATGCLIDAGHSAIGAIFKSDDAQGHLRYEGYLQALAEAGLPVHSERVLWYATEDKPSLFEPGRQVLARLEGCTACVCYNDEMALRLLHALARAGRPAPGGLSVAGIDDASLAALCEPPLTTVQHPKEALGECAADTLLALMAGEAAGDTLFAPKLVLRQSVARLRGRG